MEFTEAVQKGLDLLDAVKECCQIVFCDDRRDLSCHKNLDKFLESFTNNDLNSDGNVWDVELIDDSTFWSDDKEVKIHAKGCHWVLYEMN